MEHPRGLFQAPRVCDTLDVAGGGEVDFQYVVLRVTESFDQTLVTLTPPDGEPVTLKDLAAAWR
jgi:hypothetical protein